MFYQCFMGYLNMSQSVGGYLKYPMYWPFLTQFNFVHWTWTGDSERFDRKPIKIYIFLARVL